MTPPQRPNHGETSPEVPGDDPRHAGAYGFSRVEVGGLLVVIIVTGVLGLYRWWERRTETSVPAWVIEDVVLGGSPGPSSAADEKTGATAPDSFRVRRRPVGPTIDINTATVWDLVRLPGIGPELARRIVQDRQKRGPFVDLADLTRVRGIGSKKAAVLGGWVRFAPPALPETGPPAGDTASAAEQ